MRSRRRHCSFILAALLVFMAGAASAGRLGEVMDQDAVADRWGSAPFSVEAWRRTDIAERHKFAASLLASTRYRGKHSREVIKDLGEPTGFYVDDRHPAYFVSLGKAQGNPSWQVVFLIDGRAMVRETFVHRYGSDLEAIKESGMLEKAERILEAAGLIGKEGAPAKKKAAEPAKP